MDVMKFNLGRKFNLEKRPNYSSYILFTRANKDCFYAHQKKSRNVSFGFSCVHPIELFSKQTLELLDKFYNIIK